MAELITGIARYIHIVTAVTWVGGIFLWSMLIAPSISKRVAPAARGPFMSVVVPRLTQYLTIAGVATLLSGVWLIWTIWGDMRSGFEAPTGGYGIAMTLGLVVAIAMLVIALAFIKPAARKLLDIMAKAPPGPPSTEALTLQKKLMMGGMINMVLGFAALGAMVWAVNTGAT